MLRNKTQTSAISPPQSDGGCRLPHALSYLDCARELQPKATHPQWRTYRTKCALATAKTEVALILEKKV